MSLNVRASDCCSAVPSTVARARQVALGDAPRGAVEPQHRPGDLARHHPARDEPEAEHEQPDQREADPRPPDGALHRVDALRDAHGARGAPAGDDRHRGHQQRPAERLRAPLALVAAAVQRRRDLRRRA